MNVLMHLFLDGVLPLGGAATAVLNARIARVHAVLARAAVANAERRAAEQRAAIDVVEVDRGTVSTRPLRLVSAEETRERLIDGAVQRHPAGGAR